MGDKLAAAERLAAAMKTEAANTVSALSFPGASMGGGELRVWTAGVWGYRSDASYLGWELEPC